MDKKLPWTEGNSHSKKHSIWYKWKINEITSFLKSASNTEEFVFINSPEFSTGAKIKDLWYLQLAIGENHKLIKCKTWISVYLFSKNGYKKVQTKLTLFIINNKNKPLFKSSEDGKFQSLTQWDYHIFTNSTASFGFDQFALISELLNNVNELFENDTLTLCVALDVYDDYLTFNNPINSLKGSGRTLGDDFKDLFVNKKKCDVVIEVGNEKFEAHKLILIARSPVFEAMFSSNMKENKKNEVDIPDVDAKVFGKLLQFIYTDKVDDLKISNDAAELLKAADKYQIQPLIEMCEDFLFKKLTLENAIRTMILADRYNAKRLTELAINYIVTNFVSLKNTKEYKTLEEYEPSLFLMVLKKFAAKLEIK